MKKILSVFILFSMLCSLSAPAFAASNEGNFETETPTTSSNELPPWVEEGEVWYPANGAMTFEDDGCPNSHFPPKGYTYQGYTKGNSFFDAIVSNGIIKIVGNLPGIGLIARVIDAVGTVEWLLPMIKEGRVRTTYYKYVYTNGGLEWLHYYWYFTGSDGYPHYLACEVKTNA